MRKYLMALVPILLLIWGVVAMKNTGTACSLYVGYKMEDLGHQYAGRQEYPPFEDLLGELEGKIIPSVCSADQFHDAKEAKFSEFSERAMKQQKRLEEQRYGK